MSGASVHSANSNSNGSTHSNSNSNESTNSNSKTKESVKLEHLHDSDSVDLSDADIAYKIAEGTQGLEFTPEEDRAVLRKIDIYVTTIICVIYAVQYMDKVTISSAAVMGIRTDLKLVGNQFSWLGTGFYLGYLFFEYPAVRAIQRFPVAKALAGFVFIWGVVLVLNATAFNFASIVTARVFLGFFESAVSPALVIITSQYFKKEEQFLRVTFWFSSNGVGAILNNAISYGIAKHQHRIAIPAWKVLFILTGLLTVTLAIVLYFHLPNTPNEAWFLNERERQIAVERIRANQQAYGTPKYKFYQVKEAFKDIRTYLYIVHGVVSTVPNGGLGSFGTILINGSFGYSATESLLISLPGGALQISSAVVCVLGVYFFNQRVLTGIFCYIIAVIGSFLLAFAPSKHAQLAGYYILNYAGIGWVTALSLVTSNCLGFTKKNTITWLYFVAYSVGNTIGPQTFRAKDAPNYVPAKVTIAVLHVVSVVVLIIIYLINLFENRRRDREAERLGDDYYNPPANYEFLDLTDFENKNFRYVI